MMPSAQLPALLRWCSQTLDLLEDLAFPPSGPHVTDCSFQLAMLMGTIGNPELADWSAVLLRLEAWEATHRPSLGRHPSPAQALAAVLAAEAA